MRVTFRPLPAWPYPEQKPRPATYQSTYQATLYDLERELEAIRATEVIVGLVADERDVRLDGMLRADAKVRHPGLELSFEKPGLGRVSFHTDRHRGMADSWKDNLRAITLGLAALRAVDRYGITSGSQQYAGFAALTAGPGKEERGRQLIEQYGGVRAALQATHPDTGGDTASAGDFDAVRAAQRAQG